MARDAVAQGYAELLAREPWHWFATLTFSPTKKIRDKWTGETVAVPRFHPLHGMHLEAADKAFSWWISEINKDLYGKNWKRVPHGGLVWARGQEFHKSGRVHFHAVISAPDADLNRITHRSKWFWLWFNEFGRNRLEYPRSQDDIVGYVSKYVAKDGEVDFSRNFGTARPPQIFNADVLRKAGNPLPKPAQVDDKSRYMAQEDGLSASGPLALAFPSLTLQKRLTQTQFSNESFFETSPENHK